MPKGRTLQACSLMHSIKRDMFSVLGNHVMMVQRNIGQGEFETGHQTKKIFFKKKSGHKNLRGFQNNLELLYLDKYQTYVSICPSPSRIKRQYFLKTT